MNQILAVENKKKNNRNKNSQVGISGIVKFFAIAVMTFGIVLIGEGSYAIYRDIDDKKPANIPTVTVGRVNDQAIIHIEHNTEIMKVKYSWDDGEENVIPVNSLTTQEEITLLGYDSTLNLTIEDINGKQVTYHKRYLLDGVDITKPSIEIETQNGSNKMIIIAKDETALKYLTYQWDGEEAVKVNAETQEQKEIRREVTLTPGNKKIKVVVEDANGNVEQKEKEIVITTSKPKMTINHHKNEIVVGATDQDGIRDIVINLNGKKYTSKNINQKSVQAGPLQLQEGNNTISIEVTNINGYTETATTELQYIP